MASAPLVDLVAGGVAVVRRRRLAGAAHAGGAVPQAGDEYGEGTACRASLDLRPARCPGHGDRVRRSGVPVLPELFPCAQALDRRTPRGELAVAPSAARDARAGCFKGRAPGRMRGEGGGQAAFWQAVEWVYAHTRGDGQGLPEGLAYPGLTPAVQQCLASDRADALIRAQAAEAAKNGILATPTLRLRDRETGKTLLLPGPVEGDALLSAVDLLASGGQEAAEPSPSSRSPDMPAATAGNTAR
jgi:hypothetical protein